MRYINRTCIVLGTNEDRLIDKLLELDYATPRYGQIIVFAKCKGLRYIADKTGFIINPAPPVKEWKNQCFEVAKKWAIYKKIVIK